MREKLNQNPVAQIALIAVLAIAAGYFLLSSMGGGEEGSGGGEAAAASSGETSSAPVSTATTPPDRPLPKAVERAYESGATVVLLVVRDGGIDDALVRKAATAVESDPGVALFVVPADKIARYTPITGPLGVERAPALIAIRPRRLNGGGPAPAEVTYGFQRAEDVQQAVQDAIYHGPQLTYAPK
jgi:hypothetical protein